jgi:hypothetical protein
LLIFTWFSVARNGEPAPYGVNLRLKWLDMHQPAIDNAGTMKTFLAEQISTYGNNRLAADLGVSPQAVSKWAKRGEVPPRRVCATARLLGVAAERLSPELFGVTTPPAPDDPSN